MENTYFYGYFPLVVDPLDYVIDKRLSSQTYIKYWIIRLMKMFKYTGLPDTIPVEFLEYYLFTSGTCIIAEADGKLYTFFGTLGGKQDAYYRPTKFIVANPGLGFDKEYTIGEDCILMRNDPLWIGLMPLMSRYASLMAENVVTLRTADIMLRVLALLTAPDDSTKAAAEEYLRKLTRGELGVIAENWFLDGIKMQSPPSNNGSYLTQFIELQQYYKASFYNEVGLSSAYNMKRERLSDDEVASNDNVLKPLVEQMLACRQEDIEKVNAMFGTNIKVDFDSAWKENEEKSQLELDSIRLESKGDECENLGDGSNQLESDTEEAEASENTNLEDNSNRLDESSDETENEAEININININTDDSNRLDDSENEGEDDSKEEEE